MLVVGHGRRCTGYKSDKRKLDDSCFTLNVSSSFTGTGIRHLLPKTLLPFTDQHARCRSSVVDLKRKRRLLNRKSRFAEQGNEKHGVSQDKPSSNSSSVTRPRARLLSSSSRTMGSTLPPTPDLVLSQGSEELKILYKAYIKLVSKKWV